MDGDNTGAEAVLGAVDGSDAVGDQAGDQAWMAGEPIDAEEFLDGLAARALQPRVAGSPRAERLAVAQSKGCPVCVHGAEHGWWGPAAPTRSHCRQCCRNWNSLKEAHCPVCCAHFTHPAAADFHRHGDGCLDPAEVTRRDGRPRYRGRSGPHGVTWGLASYDPRPAHWTRVRPPTTPEQ